MNDYTRPGAEPWWEPNPLAVGTFCGTCQTRLNVSSNLDPGETVTACPVCGEKAPHA